MMSLPVWLPGHMFLLGGLCLRGMCLRGLCPGGLCLGGLCPGVSIEGSLSMEWGSLSRGSPSGGLHPGGLSEEWVVHILLECFLVTRVYTHVCVKSVFLVSIVSQKPSPVAKVVSKTVKN